MSGGTEKEGVVFSPERTVLHIDGYRVRSLVLICESYIVPDAVLLLIFVLHLGESRFEKGPVLRRNRDNERCRTVIVPHVILGFYQMLGESGPALVRITVELDHTFGLGAVSQSRFSQDFGRYALAVFGCILGRSEEFRSIESELLYFRCETADGCSLGNVVTALKDLEVREDALEHSGSGSRCGNELAFAGYRSAFVVFDGLVGFLIGKDENTSFGGCGSYDLHPRETFAESFDLGIDLFEGSTSAFNLL